MNADVASEAVAGQAHPLRWLRQSLPEGRELPEEQWRARHRAILAVVAAHAVLLPAFGLWRGWSPLYAVGEGLLIALVGALAWLPWLGRRFRSSAAALALVTSSAVLVQFWGGYIEGHFHFFVVVAIVSLYQDWVPFLLAILYVALDHGAIGTLAPGWVYGTNGSAVAHPWTWAVIHAAFVLAECVALLAAWRASELARAHAELVLGSAGDAMLGVGPDGRVTFANPAASDLVGRPPEVLVGLQADRLLDGLSAGADGFTGRPVERDLVRPDGAVIPVEVVQTPMRGANRGSVVALKDLTSRRQAEADRLQGLARENEIARLREQDAFKTLFINTAAHELRTPMTPIKIHIHVLESGKRGELNAEQRKTVDILKRNLDRLGMLIEDVLNVSRLQAGHLALERRRIGLDGVVRDVAQTFQPMAEKAGVRLAVRAPEGAIVDADPKRVSQVLFNLIDNALKFTPEGGRIDVALRADRGWAEVQVSDTGAGIRAEDIPRLFQPFSQVHDTMQQTRGGSGLGLYISSGILELHGGSIRCESGGPGQGTTFTFLLPLANLNAPPPEETDASNASPVRAPSAAA
jgi:PAS domain S-box-containing protein